ncbi:G1 family glutamic endopeptidase [Bacillus paramycoides]|uniref:G1 family glutamic endopeptidase n=1 Tax=Bacillus paramycoides TaxID=2026194 RepID=UPI003CFE0DFE
MTWSLSYWAGYIKFKAEGYTSISADWHVSAIPSTPVNPDAKVSMWVGIGGGQSLFGQPDAKGVVQAGIAAGYLNGTPNYYAWWETYPNKEQPLPQNQYPVKPGDHVGAAVYLEVLPPDDGWYVEVENATQRWRFTQKVQYTLNVQTAEVIVEAPNDVNGNPGTLPNYGTVTFDNCYIDFKPAAFDAIDSGFMYDPNNSSVIISKPSVPDSDNDGFTVAYGSTTPPPPSS